MPDVKFLRRRGYVIFCEADKIRVDRKLLTRPELARVAARERRLLELRPLETRAKLQEDIP